ncbi:MAG TPA: hypothetical protein VM345_17030 [Acidimicrobiales bacterium]|jgi:hypothetical protein|nr:hypothetical protein [Acidimicrobiales bacterium]
MRCRGDAGQIAGAEAVLFGVLLFAIGSLIIANAWGVLDARAASTAAAREAVRTIVESRRTTAEAAVADARAVADETLRGYGRSLGGRGRFVPERVDFRRCGEVTIRVEYDVPLIVLPIAGGRGRGFTAVGRHTEIVDPYRSGVPGTATCNVGGTVP